MKTAGNIAIRFAHDHELEQTVRLRWLWNVVEREQPSALGEAAFVQQAAEWARAHSTTHLAHIAVTAAGEIIGMAWLALTPRVATTESFERVSADLQSCYVLPSHRQRGIGGALVQAVLATARERGAEHVTVHTSADSIGMYARNGFEKHDRLLLASLGQAY